MQKKSFGNSLSFQEISEHAEQFKSFGNGNISETRFRFVMMSYFKNGHFTQMIWKSSRRMGVGIAIRRHDGIKRGPCQPSFQGYMMYVCIKYDPAGNRQTRDAYFKNVLPVRKHRFH